jgi:formylglycine-generating enzyme required for sulfatase activity
MNLQGGHQWFTKALQALALALRLLALLLLTAAFAHAAEKRVALVIGNWTYSQKPLRNPANDAADLAASLRRLGFEVLERKNRNSDELRRDLADFQDRLGPGTVGLFYFAGHGVQAGRGQNYLLPIGVEYKRERDAELHGLEVGQVLRRMEESGASLNLVILDACRDSPLPAEGRSTASRGLGRMEAPSGSMIAFATAPGSTADENASGRNGLYTQQLLATIETPGLRLEDVFKRVGREVEKASNNRQSPEEISKLRNVEPFYFKPPNTASGDVPRGGRSDPSTPTTPTARPGQAGGTSLDDLEKEEAARKEWAQWQARMKADFDRTAAFTGSADLQAKAWERFLATWAQDNPLSTEDDVLRERGRLRRDQAQRLAAEQVAGQSAAQQARPSATTSAGSTAAMQPGQVVKDCDVCPELVVIPAGRFTMGSPESEPGRNTDEGPQHEVRINSFLLARTTVTQGQWKAVMGSNPSSFNTCGDDCPVEKVSWNDAQDYIRKLSQRSGKTYRLPSEAEWEYAARAGTVTPFYTGQTITTDQANFNGNYTYNGSAKGVYREKTTKVGSFAPNAFGLYDMAGNVYQWVEDVWHDNYSGAPEDGSAWTTGGDSAGQVLRGGSWYNNPQIARSAGRDWISPDNRNVITGFRIARTF